MPPFITFRCQISMRLQGTKAYRCVHRKTKKMVDHYFWWHLTQAD